jgi:hypothetical protein
MMSCRLGVPYDCASIESTASVTDPPPSRVSLFQLLPIRLRSKTMGVALFLDRIMSGVTNLIAFLYYSPISAPQPWERD